MDSISPFVIIGLVAASFFLFIHIFVACRSVTEIIAAIFLLGIIVFCYGEFFVEGAALVFRFETVKPNLFLESLRENVFRAVPDYDGFPLAGKRLLVIGATGNFSPGLWSAGVLMFGYLMRVFLIRYIPNPKLRALGQEYWLFISLYLVLVAAIGATIDWAFWKVLLLTLTGILLVAGVIFRLGLDIARAVWAGLKLTWKSMRIFSMYLALWGAKVAKWLRHSLRWIRALYDKLIRPIKSLGEKIKTRLELIEKRAQEKLKSEKLDDESGEENDPGFQG